MRSVPRPGLVIVLFLCLTIGFVQAQTATGGLQGQVTDPSGAVVMGAKVTVVGSGNHSVTAISNSRGLYEIKGLAPGAYAVRVTAKGFADFETQGLAIPTGPTQTLDVPLAIAVERQQVDVEDETTSVSTDAASNASSVVLKGKDLDALSDDPDDLQSDLQALAGPSTGPDGGQIYIDGFSGGSLPPKSAIREIRVNQNPFSAQYDHLGFGRVEIFTKPGQEKFHGQFSVNVNNSIFNSLNPFLKPGTPVPDYHSEMYNGSVGGPIDKKSSFFLTYSRRNINEVAIVNGANLPCADYVITGSCAAFDWQQNYSQAVPTPRIQYEFSPRVDYQVTANNTFTGRYEYQNSSAENNGVGQLNLPSRAFNNSNYEHNVRLSDTQVINSTTINETRLQFVRSHSEQKGLLAAPAISVQDEFNAGGNPGGVNSGDQNHIELQNYTSKVHGVHFIRFGGRLRVQSDENYSLNNPYGSFVYGSRPDFEHGKPMKFTITTGNPLISLSQMDAGLYAEDDWRVKRNITVSYGLRFETQSNVPNKANFAPRIGVAWGLGSGQAAKTVIRAGFGMFYDRFSMGRVMNVLRTNNLDPSLNQRNYLVRWTGSPDDPAPFTTVPSDLSALQDRCQVDQTCPVVYAIDPSLKLPYTMQVAVSLERQLSRSGKLTFSYIGSRGLHQLLTENSLGTDSYTNEYLARGTYKQHQFMTNLNLRLGQYLSLFGWHMLGYANSNVQGGLPTDPANLNADWGRSSFDVRQRAMLGGSINLPRGFRLNPFVTINAGRPYTVYTGTDINGDTDTSNDRPWFSSGCAGIPVGGSLANSYPDGTVAYIYNTGSACYSADPRSPTNLGKVPVNYLTGPGTFVTNLRLSKTFGFGGKGEGRTASAGGDNGGGRREHGGGRNGGGGMRSGGGGDVRSRYNLTFSASARNLFNNVNRSTPTGNLSSGNFGKSLSLANVGPFGSANRRVDFQVSFSF